MNTKRITTMLSLLALLASPTPAQTALEGKWQLVASPMGVEGEGGVWTSDWDYIDFTAALSADGKTLTCHADKFVTRNGHDYPMDWQIAIEQDGDKTRLGWMCDDQQPASALEFNEPASAYAMGGADAADGEHRYIYLLSYNIDTSHEEGMTLWSGWMDKGEQTFTFPQNQQIDGIVSPTVPYSFMIGYVDSWASAKIVKMADDTGVRDIARLPSASSQCFDLQGRRLKGQPQKGLYISGGKKYVAR